MEKSIKVFAPASIGNVIVGFDVLGLAVEAPGDEVIVKLTENKNKIRITQIIGDNGKLPLNESNTAVIAVKAMMRKLSSTQGMDLVLHKNLPLGSGMGSSAASASAAVFAANELFDNPFEKKDLLPFIIEAEAAASGTAHADNAAPCLLGGLTLIKNTNPFEIHNLPYPEKLWIVLIKPAVEVLTKQARMLLGENIALNNVINQLGNLATFVAGLYENDLEMLKMSMQDYIAEPVRAMMIPGYQAIKDAAEMEDAIGCGISGSGPTMFAFAKSENQAKNILKAFKMEYKDINMDCIGSITKVSKNGTYAV